MNYAAPAHVFSPKSTLAQGMLESLGSAIVAGDFGEDALPTEADLADRYDVSRTVTREAVKMLAAKGLLAARPRIGLTVQPQSLWSLFDADVLRWLIKRNVPDDLGRHFSELRLALEPAAANLAARHGNVSACALIEGGYGRIVDAGKGEGDMLAALIAFHGAVLDAANNPFFRQSRGVVVAGLVISARRKQGAENDENNLIARGELVRAIRMGDSHRAETLMRSIVQSQVASAKTEPEAAVS